MSERRRADTGRSSQDDSADDLPGYRQDDVQDDVQVVGQVVGQEVGQDLVQDAAQDVVQVVGPDAGHDVESDRGGVVDSVGGRLDTPCWIGTSWKMNKTLAEAAAFADGLLASESDADPAITRFVVPSFTTARDVKSALESTRVQVGAQNMHWEDSGAWTGEVSAPMLVDCALDLVELGHSERRTHFGETDSTVALKVAAACRHGLTPLICVGESREERDAGRADDVLAAQVGGALSLLAREHVDATVLFAYEPIWAIGANGSPASAEYADQRQSRIRACAESCLGYAPPCLYGGSVNPDNCAELIACTHINGLFIGRAAWQIDGYLDILQRCSDVLRTVATGSMPAPDDR